MQDALDSLIANADVVLVVPPFAWLDRPSLGVHLLQGVGARSGKRVRVVYANILFAAVFSEITHNTLARLGHGLFLAERIFARAAYETPALGRDGGAEAERILSELTARYAEAGIPFDLSIAAIRDLERRVGPWADAIGAKLARVPIVGLSSSFEQNAAAIAIARAVKRHSPGTITLLGGSNCDGEMASGVRSVTDAIDHVFAGESEDSFAAFLRGDARLPIIEGAPMHDLDGLPTPEYADYYAHLAAFLSTSPIHARGHTCLAYETSRGCWWGQKSHCTFCGLNAQGMAFRAKSPDRVIGELQELLEHHPIAQRVDGAVVEGGTLQGDRSKPSRLVTMTDNIMPYSYFRELLPRLERELPNVTIMYEQKANLTLQHCEALVRAGVSEIQPGIEALSTELLQLMAKGTTAAQNVALLRYGRVTGLYLYWNLLYGFPGDSAVAYRETLELLPLIVHLQPPITACPIIIDRFSPYFDRASSFGVTNIRPAPYYGAVLPAGADLDRIAYHFEADYPTAARAPSPTARALGDAVTVWRRTYYRSLPPRLEVVATADGYELIDTRGLGHPERQSITEAQAVAALVTRSSRHRPDREWSLELGVAVERDGKDVALAIADSSLLGRFESRYLRAGEAGLPLALSP